MSVHRLTKRDARRIAVRAQLLDKRRPSELGEVVRHLTLLQLDPIAAVAPNADLVAWSRLGSSYAPSELTAALEKRTFIEHMATVRTSDYIALLRADMADWPGRGTLRDWQQNLRAWVEANDGCRRDVLDRLASSGPLPSRELPDTCKVPWRSSGWTNNQNVTKLLDLMVQRGEVAIAGRNGRERLWDLASRVYPDDPIMPADEALRRRNELRLRALGIARSKSPFCAVDSADVGTAGEPAVVDGVKGEWRVDPAQLGRPFAGRAALLSPFDRLAHDRKRAMELFDYEYQLEMYKPVAKRRWGYFALPILYGDRLVGKLDSTSDRKAGVFRVHAVHEDVTFTKTMRAAIDREIRDLARWLRLGLALPR